MALSDWIGWTRQTLDGTVPLFVNFCTTAYIWSIILKAYIRLQFQRLFPPKHAHPVWKVRKALLFRDHHDDFEDISSWFDANYWKDDIQTDHPDWDDWKVELRCTYGGRKCRIILRPEDTFTWPPHMDEQATCHFHNLRAPRGILCATLLGNKSVGSRDVDVTHRVQKYAGFNHDYHGTTVFVKDVFPMDDHDDNAQRFSGVRVMEIHPQTGVTMKICSYQGDEPLNETKIKTQ